jgi:hypothetical protein
MTLTIDSLTGLGPIDYTAAIAAPDGIAVPLKITRTLNKPTILSGLLELDALALPVPTRRARVVVASANGTLLFTGYLAVEPVALYAGVATTGPVYRYEISATSDEWLLDKQTFPLYKPVLATPAGTALRALATRAGAGLFSSTGIAAGRSVGVFEPSQSSTWSANAGELAAAGYSAYRVLNGTLSLQPAGTVTHVLNFDTGLISGAGTNGGVAIAALKTASVKELANDVTLSGAIEPAAYIAETFMGDGVTTVFQLSQSPFRPTAANRKLLTDFFNEAAIDTQLWSGTDPGSHLSLSGSGLTISGGNGYDGQTVLAALDAIELGGSLVLEAGSVLIAPASQGVLLGLYNGPTSIPNCFAGFNLRQVSGATVMTPMINGVETGTTFNVQVGHAYTLRLRLHCPEMQRVLQTYYAMAGGGVASFGGGSVSAAVTLVFELLDQGAASNTPATVLYDGSAQAPITNTPAFCTFAVVNAAQIFGSIGYTTVTQTGSAFVTSTPPGGATLTRLIGIAGQGVDCSLSGSGKLTFFAGRVPVADERITIAYRASQRAATRIQNATSIASEAATGTGTSLPGTAQWLGKVLKPPARSTADCESAALAVLSFATSRAAAVSGTCIAINPQQGVGESDIWPGDLLALTQNGSSLNVIVRRVEIAPAPSFPEEIAYKIAFANDWAEGLGLTLSDVIAADTVLPLTPTNGVQTTAQFAAGTNAAVLANLPQLQVVSATTTALQIDAGLTPPSGGGFEVRRRDGAFGPHIAQDLVLRSPVRSFSIPREAQVERYYVRMYDASNPPLYSRFSSAVFINVPTS